MPELHLKRTGDASGLGEGVPGIYAATWQTILDHLPGDGADDG